jgi:hypothetical protein
MKKISPFWRGKCQSGFTTLSLELLQEQATVVFCFKRALVSWLLSWDGHGEHSGLRGLNRRSVTHYVHGKKSCIAQA